MVHKLVASCYCFKQAEREGASMVISNLRVKNGFNSGGAINDQPVSVKSITFARTGFVASTGQHLLGEYLSGGC